MNRLYCFLILLFNCLLFSNVMAQVKHDAWLEQLLFSNASPFLKNKLQQKDTYQYQLIYTQIDRNAQNKPRFKHYSLNVDRNRYFNPASTVKLPAVLAAFEKLN